MKNRNITRRSLVFFLGVCLGLQACGARQVSLNHAHRQQVQKNTVQVLQYPAAPFTVLAAGKTMLMVGLLGGLGGGIAAAQAEKKGAQYMKNYQLQDPNPQIQTAFLNQLKGTGEIQSFEIASLVPKSDDTDDLKQQINQGWLMDFKTTGWGVAYYPTDWNGYRTLYNLRARLIKFPEARVVWETTCKVVDDEPNKARPKLKDLEANNGTALKRRLANATELCAQQLLAQFSGKNTAEALAKADPEDDEN